jgi:hypothetical protein
MSWSFLEGSFENVQSNLDAMVELNPVLNSFEIHSPGVEIDVISRAWKICSPVG